MAKGTVSDDSDDEDVEYMGHFCSECSIPPPGWGCAWEGSWFMDMVVLGCGKQVLGVRAVVLRRLRLIEIESLGF